MESLDVEELHKASWKIIKDQYQHDVDKALGVYKKLEAKDGDTTEDLSSIVSAAYFKRVHSLFIAEGIQLWGQFDPDNNEVTIVKDRSPQTQDLLNLTASQTFKNGGNVLVLLKDDVPGDNPAAAILRF